MKKYLFITRHGHAKFEAATDFARPLRAKGRKAVENTASFIKENAKKHNLKPQLCLSSAALRTTQTAEIICQVNTITHLISDESLYATSSNRWLEKITQYQAKFLVLVGHNPTFSQMVQNYCGKNIYMKPANCAFIQLEIKDDGIIYPAKLLDFHQ